MPSSCCVDRCGSNKRCPGVKLYRFPQARFKTLPVLKAERIRRWKSVLGLPDDSSIEGKVVCSRHFVEGKPARLTDKDHPDWVPSLNLFPDPAEIRDDSASDSTEDSSSDDPQLAEASVERSGSMEISTEDSSDEEEECSSTSSTETSQQANDSETQSRAMEYSSQKDPHQVNSSLSLSKSSNVSNDEVDSSDSAIANPSLSECRVRDKLGIKRPVAMHQTQRSSSSCSMKMSASASEGSQQSLVDKRADSKDTLKKRKLHARKMNRLDDSDSAESPSPPQQHRKRIPLRDIQHAMNDCGCSSGIGGNSFELKKVRMSEPDPDCSGSDTENITSFYEQRNNEAIDSDMSSHNQRQKLSSKLGSPLQHPSRLDKSISGRSENHEALHLDNFSQTETVLEGSCSHRTSDGGDEKVKIYQNEIRRLEEQNHTLNNELRTFRRGFEFISVSDKKCLYYTGLTDFKTVSSLFDYLEQNLPKPHCSFTQKEMFVMTLTKLRLNTPFQSLAFDYNVSPTTISKYFHITLKIMNTCLRHSLKVPTREMLLRHTPENFKQKFGDTRVFILDCFEVRCETPSVPKAAVQHYSNYKKNETIKFLIAVCPDGNVSFISPGFGGRCSDKKIVIESGFLQILQPEDVVLADKGFDIRDLVESKQAFLNIPSFLRSKTQFKPSEIEENSQITSLRIHVERCIGVLRLKFQILSQTTLIDSLTRFQDGENVVDLIARVCCILYNFNPSIIPL